MQHRMKKLDTNSTRQGNYRIACFIIYRDLETYVTWRVEVQEKNITNCGKCFQSCLRLGSGWLFLHTHRKAKQASVISENLLQNSSNPSGPSHLQW